MTDSFPDVIQPACLRLLVECVPEERRAAAAMATWMMMIAGIVVTAVTAGHFLDPYLPSRLVLVTGCVAATAFVVSLLAVFGVERDRSEAVQERAAAAKPSFRDSLRQTWGDNEARRFTVFVFVSMIAYSAQDLILEPFAGAVFGFTPGESTKLAGLQHAGLFAGMALAGLLGSGRFGKALWSLRSEALLFLVSAIIAARVGRADRSKDWSRMTGSELGPVQSFEGDVMAKPEIIDAVVVGGGPAGATAAYDLAKKGRSVLLLDRAGRIKPCGGAIPLILIREFENSRRAHRGQGRGRTHFLASLGYGACRYRNYTPRGRAPIPLRPLKRWDNGRDVVLAGDAAGVVAPASGEGIYYAMTGGRRRRSSS